MIKMTYEKIKISGLSEMEWLQLRKTGIGGSDAGALLGLNKISSPMKVYKDKVSEEIDQVTSEAMRVGHDLEEYVAQRFCEATGKKVRKSNYMYRSIEYPWMIADVDRLVVGEDAILECKTTNAWGASKWYDGEIPDSYIMQCFHYMAVTQKRACFIACLIMGIGFVYRKLEWDDEIINALVEKEAEFWNDYVVPRKIPEVDGSKCCDEIIGSFYPSASKGAVVKLEGFDDGLAQREKIINQIEELKTEQNKIEQDIKLFMKDNEVALSDCFKVSWSTVESTRLDSKRLKEEMPEVYDKFSKTSSTRRFQIKAA